VDAMGTNVSLAPLDWSPRDYDDEYDDDDRNRQMIPESILEDDERTLDIDEHQRIFHRLTFDTINEVLECNRAFGGRRIEPWNHGGVGVVGGGVLHLADHFWSAPTIDEIIKEVLQMFVPPPMPRSINTATMSMSLDAAGNPAAINTQIMEDVTVETVAGIINRDLQNTRDNEDWLHYEQDEAQVMFDIGDTILDDLLLDVVLDFNNIESRREQRGRY
jgi:hypothetical protein